MNILIVLIVFFALSVAYGKILERIGLTGLSCTRNFSRRSFFEGEEGEMVEIPIEEALVMEKHLQMERYQVLETMSIVSNWQ